MAKKTKDVVKKPFYPRMGIPMKSKGFKISLQRRAKFAPQLIADGFLEGVSSRQGNLIKSAFDDPNSNVVDPFSNIHSDKFEMLKLSNIAEVDPVVDPIKTENV